jgi:integrase
MQRALTDVFVRSAKPAGAGRTEISDLRCVGLVLRIAEDGGKSWSFRFRSRTGKQTRATIGRYPDVALTAARQRADDMRRAVAEGRNPVEEKRAAKAPGSAGTFGTLAERYLDEHSRRRKRSSEGDERNLRKHILPKWAGRGFSEIRRRDVIELVEALVTAGTPTLANRVQSLISSVFTFAMDADLAEANPCHRLRKRGVERVGRRVLSDEEIGLFWSKIVEPPAIRRTGLALRLTLLTGARISEIAGISRAELERLGDASRAAWIIPGTRTKNGRDHLVPLSALAQNLVLELLESLGQSDEFLLSTYNSDRKGPVSGKSLAQAMKNFGRRLAGDMPAVRTWRAELPTPHDLRRTVGTRLAELRVPREVRDGVLNHAARDVGTKHYNLHDYADEKREALNRWAVAVAAILDPIAAPVVDFADVRKSVRR